MWGKPSYLGLGFILVHTASAFETMPSRTYENCCYQQALLNSRQFGQRCSLPMRCCLAAEGKCLGDARSVNTDIGASSGITAGLGFSALVKMTA